MSEQAARVNNFNAIDQSQICYWKNGGGHWWIYLPKCGAGILGKHTVDEHADGTISVTPSIMLTGHDKGTPTQRHGWLKKGVWQEIDE